MITNLLLSPFCDKLSIEIGRPDLTERYVAFYLEFVRRKSRIRVFYLTERLRLNVDKY